MIAIDVGADLVERLASRAPDVAFVALHGRGGEDGTVQELLEILGIPYTGSRRRAPACAAWTRCVAKHALRDAGHPDARLLRVQRRPRSASSARPTRCRRSRSGSDFPLVVKPAAQGSALGIKFAAQRRRRARRARRRVLATTTGCCSSATSTGRELAVVVLDGRARCRSSRRSRATRTSTTSRPATRSAAPTSSARPTSPAEVDRAGAGRSRCATYELLGCDGFARVDLMLDDDGEPQVLEANAIPGLTDTSLLPLAAEAAGIGFDDWSSGSLELAPARAARPTELRLQASLVLAAAKSSGVTLSRNSLNFSTTSSVSSTSCSNSIADSAITSSAAKIGAPERTARASASEGRESISISRPFTESVIEA